ncbi:calcium-binding protein [Desmonostoc muscorum CCALA 125]|nr:calcium-binding protein [Desmonostoc muscorum CCALA 125]
MVKIIGSDGNDTLIGTPGNDRFIGSAGNDIITGGDGNDIIDYSSLGQAVTIRPRFIQKGAIGTDTFGDFFETVIGANGQANSIDATSDNTNVSIVADLSKERLEIRPVGLPPVIVNVKNFVNVIGTNQNDVITGNAQDNELVGSGGNDIIRGSSGNDILNGGSGIDIADYSKLGQSITVIANGLITATVKKGGGFGTDTLINVDGAVADANAVNNTLDYSQSTSSVLINLDLQNGSITVSNIPGGGTITAQVLNFDNVKGKSSDDILSGDKQNNLLFGNGGDDIISGRGGNDILAGGSGNDTLTGGLGADNFVFTSLLDGVDIMKDFKAVEGDKIQVSQVGFGAIGISDFSYDSVSGSLFFQESRFAIIENKPNGFQTNLDIQLV